MDTSEDQSSPIRRPSRLPVPPTQPASPTSGSQANPILPPPTHDPPSRSHPSTLVRAHSELYHEMDAHRLKHTRHRTHGLEDRPLPVWTHALQHVPAKVSRDHDISKSVRDLRGQIEAANDALDTSTRYQAAKEELDRLKVQKSIALHQKTLNGIKNFLKANPSAVIELQSLGFDLGAPSKFAVMNAEAVMQDIKESNDTLLTMNLEANSHLKNEKLRNKSLSSDLDEHRTKIRRLEADFASAENGLSVLRDTHRQTLNSYNAIKEIDIPRWESLCNDLRQELSEKEELLVTSSDVSKAKLSEQQDTIATLEQDKIDLDFLNEVQRDELESLKEESYGLKKDVAEQQNIIGDKDAQIQELQGIAADRLSRATCAESIVEQLRSAEAEAKQRYREETSDHLSKLRQQEKQHAQERSDASANLDSLRHELEEAANTAADIEQRYRSLQSTQLKTEATVKDKASEISKLTEQLQTGVTEQLRLKNDLEHAEQQSIERTKILLGELKSAKDRVDKLTVAVSAHIRESTDLNDELDSAYFEADRLYKELTREKSEKRRMAIDIVAQKDEMLSLSRDKTDLEARNAALTESLQHAAEELAVAKSHHFTEHTVLKALSRYLQLRLQEVEATVGLQREKLASANRSLGEQAIELSGHTNCDAFRSSHTKLLELATSQQYSIWEKDTRLDDFKNSLTVLYLLETDYEILETPGFQECLHDIKPLPVGKAFLLARRGSSVIFHGFTNIADVQNVKSEAMSMLVECHRVPCRLQLGDLYGLDQALDRATPADRTSALLILIAILKSRAKKLKASQSRLFVASLFVLHILHILCAWSDPGLADFLQLKEMFENSIRAYLNDHPMVDLIVTMASVLVDGSAGRSVAATFRDGSPPDTIEGGGFYFIPVADDILICTPCGHVVFAYSCQYTAGLPGLSKNVEPNSFRLIFKQLPLLGDFQSSWWILDPLADPGPVLSMAVDKYLARHELCAPSEESLRRLVEE